MRRTVVLIGLLALAACNRPASKSDEAASSAPSSAPAPASAAPAASSAQPAHHWAAVDNKQYLYYSHAAQEGGAPGEVQTTTIRYMGQQSDGAYVVAEVEGGAIVLASCKLPCTEVRLRGQGLDQTVALGGDSVVRAALDDAISGQLEPYPLPKKAPAGQ